MRVQVHCLMKSNNNKLLFYQISNAIVNKIEAFDAMWPIRNKNSNNSKIQFWTRRCAQFSHHIRNNHIDVFFFFDCHSNQRSAAYFSDNILHVSLLSFFFFRIGLYIEVLHQSATITAINIDYYCQQIWTKHINILSWKLHSYNA